MYVIDEMENYHAQMNKINLKWGFENKNQKRIDPPLDVKKKKSVRLNGRRGKLY
jgi:hypothetical protein